MLACANEIIRVLHPSVQPYVKAKMIDDDEDEFNGYKGMPGIAIYYNNSDNPGHDSLLQRIVGAVRSNFNDIEVC